MISIFPMKSSLGGIDIQASIEEIYSDSVQATSHPVELGAVITDHAYNQPVEILLKCGWSDGSIDAVAGAIASLFNGQMTLSEYVDGVYSQLLALQQSRVPFVIVGQKRTYTNMLIMRLMRTVDVKTSGALFCTAICREVLLVQTAATTLPAKENQASPESTAEIENKGTKQPVAAIPSPGGSLPIGN